LSGPGKILKLHINIFLAGNFIQHLKSITYVSVVSP